MRIKNTLLLLVPALVATLLLAAPGEAEAQYYGARPAPPAPPAGFIPRHNPYRFKHRPHFYVNAELTGLFILGQQLEHVGGSLDHGAGIGLGAGVRTGRWISVEANTTFTWHDETWSDGRYQYWEIGTHAINTLTADVKLHIPTWGRAEPFFQVGGGWAWYGLSEMDPYYQALDDYGYMFANGPTFNIGGGGEIWFGPHLSLGAKVLYRGMYFGESEYDLRARDTSTGSILPIHATSNFISALSIDLSATIHF